LTYSVLVVDPPWSYGKPTPDRGASRNCAVKYAGGTMTVDDIIVKTPVQPMALPDSHLYLWTTNPKLPLAFGIMKSWGFEYKTTLTWVKTTASGKVHGGGMGWFFRGATEHVLFGVRGNKPIPSALRKPNVVMAPPTEHSEKPVSFYELLRGIYGADEKMIDIYSRRHHERFDQWGDEAEPVASIDRRTDK